MRVEDKKLHLYNEVQRLISQLNVFKDRNQAVFEQLVSMIDEYNSKVQELKTLFKENPTTEPIGEFKVQVRAKNPADVDYPRLITTCPAILSEPGVVRGINLEAARTAATRLGCRPELERSIHDTTIAAVYGAPEIQFKWPNATTEEVTDE